ncbi:uncharacterized protein [Macrobrachium rosenbergii]|uniref:uncharacterized protein n=1 Tax=Macrobrachium rosenbergii TaxID=79674 RepID=UPI0034D4667F
MSGKTATRFRRFTHPNVLDTPDKILKTFACIQRQDDDPSESAGSREDSDDDSEVTTGEHRCGGHLSVRRNSTFLSWKTKFQSVKEEAWLGGGKDITRSEGKDSYTLQKTSRRPLSEISQRQRSPARGADEPEATRRSRSSERCRSKENSCLRGRRFTIISISSPFSKFADRSSDSSYSVSSDGSSEGGTRCSHFRRALSLFSVGSEKEMQFFQKEKKKETATRLLRPPTRYIYKRGVSGLPVTYSASALGLVF